MEQLHQWLDNHGMSAYRMQLVHELGVSELSDLPFIQQQDLLQIGLPPIKSRRLLAAIAATKLLAGSTVDHTATGLTSVCAKTAAADTLKSTATDPAGISATERATRDVEDSVIGDYLSVLPPVLPGCSSQPRCWLAVLELNGKAPEVQVAKTDCF